MNLRTDNDPVDWWLILFPRGIDYWDCFREEPVHAMVMVVILHMARVFLTGSYKSPREFNWAVGVILLVLTLLLSFTGYLLPWDQLALWAVTVGSNMAACNSPPRRMCRP